MYLRYALQIHLAVQIIYFFLVVKNYRIFAFYDLNYIKKRKETVAENLKLGVYGGVFNPSYWDGGIWSFSWRLLVPLL